MAVGISRVFVFNFNLFIVDGIEVTEAGTRFGDIDSPVRGQHESVDALSCASYVHFLYYILKHLTICIYSFAFSDAIDYWTEPRHAVLK